MLDWYRYWLIFDSEISVSYRKWKYGIGTAQHFYVYGVKWVKRQHESHSLAPRIVGGRLTVSDLSLFFYNNNQCATLKSQGFRSICQSGETWGLTSLRETPSHSNDSKDISRKEFSSPVSSDAGYVHCGHAGGKQGPTAKDQQGPTVIIVRLDSEQRKHSLNW